MFSIDGATYKSDVSPYTSINICWKISKFKVVHVSNPSEVTITSTTAVTVSAAGTTYLATVLPVLLQYLVLVKMLLQPSS
jgi:hypothetical protein